MSSTLGRREEQQTRMLGGFLKASVWRATRVVGIAFLLAWSPYALAEGTGIKLGDARLHPRVDVEGHYVLNPSFASKDAGPLEAAIANENDFYLAAGPGMTLKLETPKTQLSMDAGIQYRRYFKNTQLSTFAGEAGVAFDYNRGGLVTLRLSDRLVRYADGGNDSVTTRLLHTVNVAGLGLDIKPGGGALVVNIDYRFYYDYYDRDANTVADSQVFDNYRHKPELRVAWKFLPRTAIFLAADTEITRFPNGSVNTNFSTNILRSYLGVVGDITGRVKALLKAGYGNSFSDGSDNLQTVVGQAELSYDLSETASTKLGYARTIQPTTIYGFMGVDQVYLRYAQQFFGKTNLSLGAEYRLYNFGTPAPGYLVPSGPDGRVPDTERTDQDIVVRFGLEHFIREWISVGVFNVLDFRSSTDAQFSYLYNDAQLRISLIY